MDCHVKTTLHTQLIKIFRIATSINVFNLCGNYKYFDWFCVQSCFGISIHHH